VWLGRPIRRQPAATRWGEDQCPALLADKGESVGLIDRSAPELETPTFERPERGRRIADDPELGEADDLARAELARVAVLLEPVMRDQLDDVPGRIVEVDGSRIPVLEGEDVAEQLDALAGPPERRVEAVARDEQREVVERAAPLVDLEMEPCLSDDDRLSRERQPELAAVEILQIERCLEGHLGEAHRPEHTISAVDEAWRAELAELIAIPSVSADPAHREDVKRAGEWVCDFIRRIGGTAELTPFGERELVLGDIPASNGAKDAPTVLVYNHFDVQPPAPLDLWVSDPFELDIRGEWAYARGVTDDKGQLWLVLKAAQRLVEANALPVNLRIAFDGEEEVGGHTISDWVTQDERGADACVIFDGGFLRRGVPVIELATRGLVGFEVKVTTGARDLHSGMYGGAALNAIHVLMHCLEAVLAGPTGVLPEPLREGIAPPTPEELEAWSKLPPGSESLAEQGARPLDAKAAEEFYVRTWAEPSADVNGILGGKPGVRNTTLSIAASAEFSIRLAPGQEAQTIGPAAERLLREAAPEGAEVDIVWFGSNPGLVSADAPAVQLAVEAFEQGVGIRPLLTRVGGSIPLMPALTEKGIDTILTGFGLPESNIHSPNERFLVPHFASGIDTAAALFTALGRL
jgi:acetylornithine deacetylase/succinyl-diaminopimelate desuccinylase-like protein